MASVKSLDPLESDPQRPVEPEPVAKQEIAPETAPETAPVPDQGKARGVYEVCLKLLQSYLKVFLLFLGFLSLYWGSTYHRQDRWRNMNMVIVSEDTPFTLANGTTVQPLLANAFLDMVFENSTVNRLGGWQHASIDKFRQTADKYNNTVEEEIIRQVHHQKYWTAVYIRPNATQLILEALKAPNTSTLALSGQVALLVTVFYESGRHYSALNQYVIRNIYLAENVWLNYYVSQQVYQPLVQTLSDDEKLGLVANNNTLAVLNTMPTFNITDGRPSVNAAILGPSELGLIYALVFSFHQFNFSLEIYAYIRSKLKVKHYLVWRFFASQVNCLVLSLVYCLVTIAFKIPINVAFGRSGFLVFWMFMYLFIAAVGGLNEVMATLLLAYDQKLLLAPWMVFNIVLNVSTVFAPFELMPKFYRYGYAMPMYNVYEALKVVFFDTWKGHLGRNLGVLAVWIVVTQFLLLVIYQWQNKRVKRKEANAAQQKAKEAEKLEEIEGKIDTKPS